MVKASHRPLKGSFKDKVKAVRKEGKVRVTRIGSPLAVTQLAKYKYYSKASQEANIAEIYAPHMKSKFAPKKPKKNANLKRINQMDARVLVEMEACYKADFTRMQADTYLNTKGWSADEIERKLGIVKAGLIKKVTIKPTKTRIVKGKGRQHAWMYGQ